MDNERVTVVTFPLLIILIIQMSYLHSNSIRALVSHEDVRQI